MMTTDSTERRKMSDYRWHPVIITSPKIKWSPMSHVSLSAKYSLGGNRAWLRLEIALWEAHGVSPVIHYALTIWDRLMCQFSTTTFTTSTTHPC